jgi:hypothetical protein
MLFKRFVNFIRRKFFLNAIEKSVSSILEKQLSPVLDLANNLVHREEELLRGISSLENHLSQISSELHSHIHDACMATNVMVGDNIQKLFTAYHTNSRTFSPFKRCYEEKSLVIIGAGPSVNGFVPISDAIYIGLNRAFKFDKVKFDYLFSIDIQGIKDFYSDFFDYRNEDCVKFIGDQDYGDLKTDRSSFQIPESFIKGKNVKRYITRAGGYFNERFTYHLESEPLGNFSTVSLQAMQFALFTNPRKIYLVGIDCTTSGHFTGESKFLGNRSSENWKSDTSRAISDWKSLKDFASTYYPDTEIISVNPVGLKGIFKDWYQDEGEEPK